jgi:fatty acid desaturase
MSPKMYSLVWVAIAVIAAILWLGGVFSLFIGVVFGFVAFGLVFMGMMCVLPSIYHPTHADRIEPKQAPAKRSVTAAIPTYRSV